MNRSFRPLLRVHEQHACAVGLGVWAMVIIVGLWSMGPKQFVANGPLPGGANTFRVKVNEADWTEWAMLPGIGRTLAQRIVERRTKMGAFRTSAELLEVRGIGPRKLEAMSPFLIWPSEADEPDAARSDGETWPRR